MEQGFYNWGFIGWTTSLSGSIKNLTASIDILKRRYGYVKLDDKCSLMEDQPTPSQEPLAHDVSNPLAEYLEELVATLHEKALGGQDSNEDMQTPITSSFEEKGLVSYAPFQMSEFDDGFFDDLKRIVAQVNLTKNSDGLNVWLSTY